MSWIEHCDSFDDALMYAASKSGHLGPYAIEALGAVLKVEIQNFVPYVPHSPQLQAFYRSCSNVFNHDGSPKQRLPILTTLSKNKSYENADTFNHYTGM